MSIGLALAVSTLPWDGSGCGSVLGYWHEYLTFVVSVQGVATGLATLIWLLVASYARPTNRPLEAAMTEPVASASAPIARYSVWSSSMLFAFSYSEQLISGLYPVVGQAASRRGGSR